ncbi:MAG: hypothetical protein L0Z62_49820 [Gemmataceae bacterium]|nr:hypothetical protein [Gemmataceae bacterium]
MNQPPDAIGPDEFILRRIHKSSYDPGLPIPINFAGFRPTRHDTKGLSVFRAKYTSAVEVAAAGRKPGEYCVVRLPVQALYALQLTVVPDEQPEGPRGHALIPELNVTACEQDKKRLRDVQRELARLAGLDIVHFPDT